VLLLLSHLGVSYREMLFNIHEFVDRNPENNRRSNVQKILDIYPQCTDYYFCVPSSFSVELNYIGITNCTPQNWNHCKVSGSEIYNVIEQITSKIPKPWNLAYYISFNQINWFKNVLPHIEITTLNQNRVATLLPYSSNISIGWNSYEKKNIIYLSFEVGEDVNRIDKYLKDTSLFLNTKFKSLDTFVYFNEEEILMNKAIAEKIQPILERHKKIILSSYEGILSSQNDAHPISPKKAIIKLVKNTEFLYFGCENGVYSISKIDKNNHQIKIYLDYANRNLSAAIRYTGINFMYSFDVIDIIPNQQEDIEIYIKYIFDAIMEMEINLFNIISTEYPPTPSWFIYSNT
jgi:hypothetical protein